MEIDFYDCRWY